MSPPTSSGDQPSACPATTLSAIADYAALGLPLLPGDILAIRRAAGELRRLAGEVERLRAGVVGAAGGGDGAGGLDADGLLEKYQAAFG